MSLRCLVGLAIASACGGTAHVAATPAPAVDRLVAIRIEGNRAIDTAALEPALALYETVSGGAALDPYVLTLDTQRIRAAYLRRGFFEVQVTARIERDAQSQVAVFSIAEGRRAMTRVEIVGLPPELAMPRARALVGLEDGAAFDYDAYEAAKLPLAALVANVGYARAEVGGTVIADPAAAIATARYEVTSGVRCTFGAIRLTGVQPALEAAVRARLRFATGDRFSRTALDDSQAEIYDLGRFSTVQLVQVPGAGAVVDVAVEASEANRHELHVGAGFGYEPATYELRGRGGFSVVPAGLPLMTLALDTRFALTIPHNLDREQLQPKLRALASVQYADLGRPRLRGEAEVGADYQTVEAYAWTGEHVKLGLGSPLGARWLQARIGWLLERVRLDPGPALDPPGCLTAATPARTLGLCDRQLLGAYQASLIADLRDNPIEPHRGVYIDLRASKGTRFAGGELSYLQVTPELRGYVSIGATVLAARARVGEMFGELPVTERLFSGGSTSHRGFSERRLSPTARDCAGGGDVVIGGAGLIETGVELRRPLGTLASFPVGANLFLDGGDVQCTAAALDLRQLSWAIGIGGWAKLVGDLKLRIGLGYRLNSTSLYRLPADADTLDRIAFHIGIGEAY